MSSHILVGDVLGFSRLVSNLGHGRLDDRLKTWVDLVKDILSETNIQHSQLISDTIFVREDDSVKGLERLLQFSKLLLERGLSNHFPVRGAISKGDLTWGPLTYGKALIRGHELERQQDWIGIACESGLAAVPWSWDLVCCYPVPKKSGSIRTMPAVVWNIPDAPDLINKCCGQGLLTDGEHVTWELHSKLNNTLAFSMYVQRARQQHSNPAKYHSQFSIGAI